MVASRARSTNPKLETPCRDKSKSKLVELSAEGLKSEQPAPCNDRSKPEVVMPGARRKKPKRTDEKTDKEKSGFVMLLTLRQLDSSSFVITPGPKLASDCASNKDSEFTRSNTNEDSPVQV